MIQHIVGFLFFVCLFQGGRVRNGTVFLLLLSTRNFQPMEKGTVLFSEIVDCNK